MADGWLLWGSEIKALLSSGLVAARPDPKGIDLFFHTFCAGTTRTFFEGIQSIPPGHFLRVRDGRVERKPTGTWISPTRARSAGWPIRRRWSTSWKSLMRQSVERRLRGDVPVVSYISGGLDSTVVLGLSSRERGHAVPSFTIGLDRAGPDERSHAAESAAALGSHLTTVTMNRADIVAAYPELIRAAEGPVMDSSCACLMRLAGAVHAQGYKVVLTGEGADEALAGYAWFKTQAIRERLNECRSPSSTRRSGAWSWPRCTAIRRTSRRDTASGAPRTAQQDVFDLMAQGGSFVYSDNLWTRLAGHAAFDDLDITNDRFTRWAPLNQSLYVGYKVMLAGLLLGGQGGPGRDELVGRGAIPAPGRRRHRFLRLDRARVQAARADGQMAAAPGGRGRCRPGSPTARRRCSGPAVPGPSSPRTVRTGSTSSSVPSRSAPAGSTRKAWLASVPPRSDFPPSPPSGSSWT